MQELARAFVRQKQSAEAVQCSVPATIQAKIDKWETRIRYFRESGKPIITDELESLLAGDINWLFPEQEQDQELEGDEITNIDAIVVWQGNVWWLVLGNWGLGIRYLGLGIG